MIRIKQLEEKNIPYCFLFNGEVPSDFPLAKEKYFHYPTLSVDKFNDKNLTTPWATKAFQESLQVLYKEHNLEAYDYILRLNVSTYVQFEKFNWMVGNLPKSGLIGGPLFVVHGKIFANGTAMLFSNDVARAFAFDTQLDETLCTTTNDDVVISWSLTDRYILHDLNFYYAWYESYKDLPSLQEFVEKIKYETVFYRIKNDCEKRDEVDTSLWYILFNIIH